MNGSALTLIVSSAFALASISRGSRAEAVFYHCGSRRPGEPFSLAYAGTGEGRLTGGVSAGGRAVYLTDNLDVAQLYCGYVEQPHLSRVRVRGALREGLPWPRTPEQIASLLAEGYVGVSRRFDQRGLKHGPFTEVAIYDPSAIEDVMPDGSMAVSGFSTVMEQVQVESGLWLRTDAWFASRQAEIPKFLRVFLVEDEDLEPDVDPDDDRILGYILADNAGLVMPGYASSACVKAARSLGCSPHQIYIVANTELGGKGVGLKAYELLARSAAEFGAAVAPHRCSSEGHTSERAGRVWLQLAERYPSARFGRGPFDVVVKA